MSDTIKIITYNILSSSLCSPTHHTSCDPEHLHPDKRMPKIQGILEKVMKVNTIICLQEVSRKQEEDLQPFFHLNDYTFIVSHYSKEKNGYMGVGIAFPHDKFTLRDTRIVRVADGKKWVQKPKPGKWSKVLTDALTAIGILGRPEIDPLEYAQHRQNTMVALHLKTKRNYNKFWVSTYHMPCAYRTPLVMTIHAALVAQAIQRIAGDKPYILVGDFNLKPIDEQYKMLTTGELNDNNPVYFLPKGDNWLPTVLPMKSAYKELNGVEPYFTNYAQPRGRPVFIECLDYIFYNGLEVVNCCILPKRSDVNGPLPNAGHPSDHIPIGAAFQIETN